MAIKNLKFKHWFIIAFLLLAVIWGLSLAVAKVMVPELNPTARYQGVILSTEADHILRESCYDCHSNETKTYWYSNFPLVAVLIAHDIKDGRDELNFSEWDKMSAKAKRKNIKESLKTMADGEMPMYIYTLPHPQAAITPAELTLVKQAASQAGY